MIAVNRVLDPETATAMAELFVEAIAAPGFSREALKTLTKKKNLRLLQVAQAAPSLVIKSISGGFLAQTEDRVTLRPDQLEIVTKRKPSAEEMAALEFAWKVVKHVKSNAIVYAVAGQTVGVGAGQMSRVDAARLGASKAVLPLKKTVAASDAFFPFPDGVEEIASAGGHGHHPARRLGERRRRHRRRRQAGAGHGIDRHPPLSPLICRVHQTPAHGSPAGLVLMRSVPKYTVGDELARCGRSCAACLCLPAFSQGLPPLKNVAPPPEQPLPFSHRAHVSQGLKCLDCHPVPDPGDFAEIVSSETCMLCHSSIKTDSPAIQKLADYPAARRPDPVGARLPGGRLRFFQPQGASHAGRGRNAPTATARSANAKRWPRNGICRWLPAWNATAPSQRRSNATTATTLR